MIIPANDQTACQQSLQQLYDLLDQAYWVASTIEAKDAINGLTQALHGILTTLNQGALDDATAEYATLKATVAAVNSKIESVQAQINNWIHVVSLATQIAGAMDQALSACAKVFAL
jgi:hypothetical protein